MKARAWILPVAVFAAGLAVNPAQAATPAPTAEADGTIAGMTIARANGHFLGLEVADNVFKLTTYNAHKKPEKTEITSAVLHWPVHYQPNEERTMLTASDDGTFLTSEKAVRAPLSFKLYIALFVAGTPDPVESYVVDFRG